MINRYFDQHVKPCKLKTSQQKYHVKYKPVEINKKIFNVSVALFLFLRMLTLYIGGQYKKKL